MSFLVSLLRHCLRGLFTLSFFSCALFFVVGEARAQCPVVDNIGWGRGATVRFFLNANLNEEQKRQVRWGLAEWTRANSVNNSRVRFEEDFTGGNFQFHILNGSLGGNTPAFANKVFSSDGTVVSGTLTFDPNAVFGGTNTLIANPTQAGYETFIIKLTLHEVGHTMGLDHPALPPGGICAQQDGLTVMNYICNVNDSANNMPVRVAECDQSAINSETRYPAFTQSPNPIDESTFFVRQHYLDFLNREPDAGGLSFWVNNIESCGANADCRNTRRIDTSAAFFLSIEFQETGYFVYRVYQAAFGDLPNKPVPLTIQEFLPETQRVGRNVIVGLGDWQGQIDANKNAFISELMARGRFSALYPSTMPPEQFVDTLNANAGGVLSASERNTLVGDLTAAGNTTQARASILRRVAEDADLVQREFSPAFVLMQYYGYLRRSPDDPPDADFRGWQFWLDKLNTFNGDWRGAQMVASFLSSLEYRRRFGQP
ncbi:MAG TPA: DUF4214 domain-containing protein [Pyrinomonadaceae bacterium]|nr:DUF4214 domain-containing protein [Pyrinomonadaceae bacterium]